MLNIKIPKPKVIWRVAEISNCSLWNRIKTYHIILIILRILESKNFGNLSWEWLDSWLLDYTADQARKVY